MNERVRQLGEQFRTMFDLKKLQEEIECWIEYSREFIVPSMQSHWEPDVKELYEFNKSDLIGAIKCIEALATGQSMEKVIELYTVEIKLRENAIRLVAQYSTRGREFLDAVNDFYPFVNDGKMFHFTSNNDKIDRDFFTGEVGKDFILDAKHQEWDQKCKEYKETPAIISGAVELIVALAYGQQYEEVYRKWHSYYYAVGEAANLNILNLVLRFSDLGPDFIEFVLAKNQEECDRQRTLNLATESVALSEKELFTPEVIEKVREEHQKLTEQANLLNIYTK